MKIISILLWIAVGVTVIIEVIKFDKKAYKDELADRFLLSLKINLSKEDFETVTYFIEKANENMLEQSNK